MNLKKYWNKIPTWLKGGLIGIVIGVIFFSLYNACGFVPNVSTPKNNLLCLSVHDISLPNMLVYAKFVVPKIITSYNVEVQTGTPTLELKKAGEIQKANTILGEVVLFISYIAIYFLIGSLIGLIIQKIKSKK